MGFSVASLYQPVENEFALVQQNLHRILSQTRSKALLEVNHYLLANPGKRLRPLLCLLAFKASAPNRPIPKSVIEVASALELLHMASLVHDDVIDHAEIRHNKPTIHKVWGEEVAIPMGVYLYTLSLQCIARAGDLHVLKRVSHAVKILCEGELRQVFERGNAQLDLIKYLIILKKKTGILFSTACHCGSYLADASKRDVFDLQFMGYALGMLFQISDDYMDVMGNTQALGKTAGQDVAMGEITLPFLYLLDEVSPEKQHHIHTLLRAQDPSALGELQAELKASNALEKTKSLALNYADRAVVAVDRLPKSPYRKHLIDVISALKIRAFGL